MLKVLKVENDNKLWAQLVFYAENCSWIAGKHLATIMKRNTFCQWEGVFVAVLENEIVGFCTFLKSDYYPENKYYPWISSIFVDEKQRGNRISEKMISKVIEHAKKHGFTKVYIPSDMKGFYEKYGFKKIDQLKNYDGNVDNIFEKEI